jgi:glutamate synthase (NADPH/NADH) small chain
VVGAGPAGLAFAERLARAGWQVSVYERNREIGGLLATGVPPFKLERSLLARRRDWLEAAGVRFALGCTVDGARVRQLVAGHDALFLGTGGQRPRAVDLSGRETPGVVEALDLLAAVGAGRGPDLGGARVLVLGGGDTAMDCARSALRLGAAGVTLAYRGPAQRLRASPGEAAAARAEGVDFLYEHVPLAVAGGERVGTVSFATAHGERSVACERVILAFGQQPDPQDWLAALGVATDEAGRIRVDAAGRTSNPRVYAGGDNTRGPDLVVQAVAAGRRAAEGLLAAPPPRRARGARMPAARLPGRELPA